MFIHPYTTVAMNITKLAGRLIERAFYQSETLHIEEREKFNLCTQINHKVEAALIEGIYESYPEHQVFTEGRQWVYDLPEANVVWIINPLDGSHNFIHRIPYFSISIAVQEKGLDGQWHTRHAMIYNPITGEMFTADHNRGAQLNLKRLRMRKTPLDRAFLGVSRLPRTQKSFQYFMTKIHPIYQNILAMRQFGSTALALSHLANGQLDIFFAQNAPHWETAAGVFMVHEAGGMVTDEQGGAFSHETMLIAAQLDNHATILRLYKD